MSVDYWRLACSECGVHFPKDIEVKVVGKHWQGHYPQWSEDHQEPSIALHLVWIGPGTPPHAIG